MVKMHYNVLDPFHLSIVSGGSTILKGNNSYNNIAFEEELTV